MSFKYISYLELWWPFCSAEQNHLCNNSNGGHSGPIFSFKPEKNLEFFRLKNGPRDAAPGRLE